ncbi:MAG: twin-arginine translocation signal domain-containing protein [Syntrophales bacterium]
MSRRHFLKSAATAGTGFTLPSGWDVRQRVPLHLGFVPY